MASKNRRVRLSHRDSPYSFRFITTFTIIFLFFIGIFVIFISDDRISGVDTLTISTPQDIPLHTLKALDAVLVLGGGVPDTVDDPPIYVQRRCDDAAKVVKSRKAISSETLPILCLSAGTAHLPQLLSKDGLPVWESTACAAYLSQNHGLSQNVFVETTSYDTIGNAFYSRMSYTDINGWRNLLIITNQFHMERTKTIFDWIFRCDNHEYRLYFLASPNVGLSADAIKARKEREAKSEMTVREKLVPKYKTMKDIWRFLNNDHSLYTAWKLVERAKGNGDAKASDMVKRSYGAASS
jgi:uncharacterized SAM-binding protein YcdF (DUF218 family)